MLLEYFFLWQTIFRVFCVQYISHKNNLKNSKKKKPQQPNQKNPSQIKEPQPVKRYLKKPQTGGICI